MPLTATPDSKMKTPQLSSQQHDELIEQYVELITDSMDWKTMYHFIRNTLTEDLDKLSQLELFEEISLSFDEETLNDLVDNVTTVTYGLAEGESITFPSSS
tara:strand:- start:710 stop:1012 length:303 start_codon:yes stop_codon:yes gene_type:complete